MFLMMPKRRDSAKSVSEYSIDLNMFLSSVMALLSVTGLAALLLARDLSTVGRTVEKAVMSWYRVLVKGNELHPSPVSFEGRHEGGVFLGLLLELNVSVEVPTEADLDDDEGALFLVKRARVGGGSVLNLSSIDEVW